MRWYTGSGLVLIGLLMAGCGSAIKNWDPTAYTVQSGDTLYSIAWRYEIDPAELARWNNLSSPSLIYPGQRLRTRKPDRQAMPARVEVYDPEAELIEEQVQVEQPARPDSSQPLPAARVVVRKNDTLYSIASKHRVAVAQLIRANGLKPPYRIYPGQQLRLSPASPGQTARGDTGRSVKAPVRQTDKTVSAKKPHAVRKTRLTWQWPVRGRVIKRFNSRRLDAKGIDIRVRHGRDVRAAASGKVVYSGNGLISYGNLVIVKHNDTYLSAYANNHKLLVREGETVKQGQVIAELPQSRSQKPVLHFEIRKKGKPVDPLHYLPSS